MFKEGFVYHIKDEYFEKANDDKLMRNKECGTYRPTFLCIEDKSNPGLLWVVPMSSRIAKFQAIHDKQQTKYGKCLTIVIGKYDGQQSAFFAKYVSYHSAILGSHSHPKRKSCPGKTYLTPAFTPIFPPD